MRYHVLLGALATVTSLPLRMEYGRHRFCEILAGEMSRENVDLVIWLRNFETTEALETIQLGTG